MNRKIPKKFINESNTPRLDGTYSGLIRGTTDPQRNGRLTVWISDFGPDEVDSYVTVAYASPFAGATDYNQDEDQGQKSYGWWATPPDINNEVLVCFINGDITRGYWFACLYPQNMNHMVPGIGFQKSSAQSIEQEETIEDENANIPSNDATQDDENQGVIPISNAFAIMTGIFEFEKLTVRNTSNNGLRSIGAAVDVKPQENMTFQEYTERYKQAGFVILEARIQVGENRDGDEDHWYIALGEKGSEQYPNTVNRNNGEVIIPDGVAANIAAGADGLPNEEGFNEAPDASASYGDFEPFGPPRIEYNKRSEAITSPTSKSATGEDTVPREVFRPLANGLIAQGLNQDQERGISNSSARRESPSKVMGLLSPRGNSIHIDDGNVEETNEFIRIRTRSGTQVLVHESSGYVYMNSKLGNSWVEISDNGIDMFSEGPISIASNSDVNIHAGGNLNLQSAGNTSSVSSNFIAHAAQDVNLLADNNILSESINDTFFIATNNFGVGTGGHIGLDSEGDIRMASCGLNIRKAIGILDNSGGANPTEATRPASANNVSRRPTHEPFDRGFEISAIDENGQAFIDVVGSDGSFSQEPVDVPPLDATDLDWIATAMMDEARGESVDGRACVAAVIYNRMAVKFPTGRKGTNRRPPDPWGASAKGIILAAEQFEGFNNRGHGIKQRETQGFYLMRKYQGTMFEESKRLAQEIQANTYRGSRVYSFIRGQEGALWFFNPREAAPSWQHNLRKVGRVLNHDYFWSPTHRS